MTVNTRLVQCRDRTAARRAPGQTLCRRRCGLGMVCVAGRLGRAPRTDGGCACVDRAGKGSPLTSCKHDTILLDGLAPRDDWFTMNFATSRSRRRCRWGARVLPTRWRRDDGGFRPPRWFSRPASARELLICQGGPRAFIAQGLWPDGALRADAPSSVTFAAEFARALIAAIGERPPGDVALAAGVPATVLAGVLDGSATVHLVDAVALSEVLGVDLVERALHGSRCR